MKYKLYICETIKHYSYEKRQKTAIYREMGNLVYNPQKKPKSYLRHLKELDELITDEREKMKYEARTDKRLLTGLPPIGLQIKFSTPA